MTKKINLKENEVIERIIRKYWVSILYKLILGLILLSVPFIFIVPLFKKGTLGISIFGVVLAIAVLMISRVLLVWYGDVFVITNHKIVDINKRGMFDVIVSEIFFNKVEDVSYRQKGIFPSLFGYGSIYIQTDGGNLILEIEKVKNPQEIHTLINSKVKDNFNKNDKFNVNKFINNIDFSEQSIEELSDLLEKMLDDIGDEKFAKIISEFIDLEDEE